MINPDDIILWRHGPVVLNATILFTWVVIVFLGVGSWLVTRRLSSDMTLSRAQNMLEVLVIGMNQQIRETSRHEPGRFLPFVGSLFVFIAVSNALAIVPYFEPPTASLSTTAALACCVFIAVPLYGIASEGLWDYLRNYIEPSVFMLPLNVIGELSRTVAMAVRLYGNMMSDTVMGAILLSLAPLFVPAVMKLFGLLMGLIQAYIFTVLAMVFIASVVKVQEKRTTKEPAHG